MDFPTRKSLFRASLTAFLGAQRDLCLLTQMPGNIGDHLIWAGTQDLLGSEGLHYTSVPWCELEEKNRPQGTLLVPGSGAFSTFYHEWLPNTVLKASDRFQKVIILPSSFNISIPIVAECLSRPNVYAFAREVRSYRSAKGLGRIALSLDCAVYYRVFNSGQALIPESLGNDSLLLALRVDKESLLTTQGVMPNPAINQDISLTKVGLNEWIHAIDQASTVVTDRLHIAVASVLLGKRLMYTDPDRQKITDHFGFTFRDTFNDRVRKCSLEWLLANDFVIRRGNE